MLAIRMQRTGRKGHAMFRVIVQDSRRTPTSGKVVAQLGSYDPHAKNVTLDKEKASFYLQHGAQPSDRAARLLQSEGVELPTWVSLSAGRQGGVRNPDKRRSTAPAPEVVEAPAPAEEPVATEEVAEVPADTVAVETTEESPAAEASNDAPAEAEPATPADEASAEPETEVTDEAA